MLIIDIAIFFIKTTIQSVPYVNGQNSVNGSMGQNNKEFKNSFILKNYS